MITAAKIYFQGSQPSLHSIFFL
uniref:Uncharacterized protein n=1 Tax=Arundo donax TaxID=35708 RepID=A0A0A8ZUS0_ARUDO